LLETSQQLLETSQQLLETSQQLLETSQQLLETSQKQSTNGCAGACWKTVRCQQANTTIESRISVPK
jgi:hypothetical protein